MKLPRIPKLWTPRFVPLERPRFPVDRALVSKQLRAAEKHPVNGIKRVILEEDTFITPPAYEDGLR